MTATQLHKTLQDHRDWVNSPARGARADLRGADLRNMKLVAADLRFIDFRGADLTGCDLTDANCSHADFRGANLSKAICQRTTFTNAKLQGASLQGADFRGADMRFADTTGAFFVAPMSDAELRKAVLANIPESRTPKPTQEKGRGGRS